jgi:DNA-binding NtrC family response regulator
MFGHTRGAFSGAVAARAGHVAEAEGGTLFIDEVAELTPRGQAKLLRLIQEREYRRLGETQTRRANVRFVTAANADLEERVTSGSFREDLLFRLTVVTLRLPPLRERGDDVLVLARHFLKALAAGEGRPVAPLPRTVAEALRRYTWPGNVRELASEMHRLVLRAGSGPIRPAHLSARVLGSPTPAAGSLRSARTAFERDFISGVLPRYGGNRTRAASAMGITRQALVMKMRQLGL